MHKTQILPMGKNFQEIGQKYKEICINGWNMAQNVPFSNKNFQNYSRGLQDTSQKAYFERDPTQPHPNHIHIKVALEGLDGCYIGPEWRKVAEVG